MRENHYAISCIKTKSFSGFQFARRITLLILPKCRGLDFSNPVANLIIFFGIQRIIDEIFVT
jgi:hypothetical protein